MYGLDIMNKNIFVIMHISEAQKYQIQITTERQRNVVRVKNIDENLTYIVLSSEPGRKIIHPPHFKDNQLDFFYKKCDGIFEQRENFCVVGFSNFMHEIKETTIMKASSSIPQKILYISKIQILFKPETNTYFLDQRQKYRFSLSIMAPCQITAMQIQQFLEKVTINYSKMNKIDVKRNTLILEFTNEEQIKQQFVLKGLKSNQNGEYILTYWAFTYHRTLYTYQPVKIIELPRKEKIRDFLIHSQWLIIATEMDTLFLHLYRPTIHFLTLTNIKINGIIPFEEDKIILLEYKYMLIYQLFSYKNPILLGKAKTKKMETHTLVFYKKSILFAGINYSSLFNERSKEKQIFVVQNFTDCNIINKHFTPDKTLEICKKSENIPIRNLKFLPKPKLFICSCGESIYLFHLQTCSLISSVDLLSPIKRLFPIDYPINIVNCLISAKGEKNIIRIGFEQYGQIIGTEVTNIQKYGNSVDFCVRGNDVFSTDGEIIEKFETNKSAVLYSIEETNHGIKKIIVSNDSLVYIKTKEDTIQTYFMQL